MGDASGASWPSRVPRALPPREAGNEWRGLRAKSRRSLLLVLFDQKRVGYFRMGFQVPLAERQFDPAI